jgi:hypothetical protein
VTPEEREAYLDEVPTIAYYHRDGTKAKTNREGFEIFSNRWNRESPDYARIAETDRSWYRLSTVFLSMDHSFSVLDEALVVPVLFETMMFTGESSLDNETWRYFTEADAAAKHKRIVRYLTLTRPLWRVPPRIRPRWLDRALQRGLARAGR